MRTILTFRHITFAILFLFAASTYAQLRYPFGISKFPNDENPNSPGIGLNNSPAEFKQEKPDGKRSPILSSRAKTPFIGHIDVDLNDFKPSISCQNLKSDFATYSISYNDVNNYFGAGISGSTVSNFPPNTAFLVTNRDLIITGDPVPEFMRVVHSTGAVGIGTSTPATGSKLHVVQDSFHHAPGVIYGNYTAAPSDIPGVYGQNDLNDFFGIGVKGLGGWVGVYGQVQPTGPYLYGGVLGEVTGGSGQNIGVYGYASGSNVNYGIYGVAVGGANNFAGYFEGIVRNLLNRSDFSTYKQGYDLEISGTSGLYAGITGRYTDLSNNGAAIFFAPDGSGLNIGEPTGVSYAAVNASAFNVVSDQRMKKDITPIAGAAVSLFMQQLRGIQSVTYWYENEDKLQREVPHIGVIAQSLPAELQTEIAEKANGASEEKRLGVSLSDWMGLLTVGVKENDRRLLELEEINKALSKENAELKNRLQTLEKRMLQLEKKMK